MPQEHKKAQEQQDQDWLNRVTDWTISLIFLGVTMLAGDIALFFWLGISPVPITAGLVGIMCLALYPVLSRRSMERLKREAGRRGYGRGG